LDNFDQMNSPREANSVKIFTTGMTIMLLGLLAACGSDTENETQEQAPQGVLSTQQQQALDAANSVEQILLDSAQARQKELEARLRAQ
jgi:hypothetical protein